MKKILFSMLMTFAALLDTDTHAVSTAEMKLKEIKAGQEDITPCKKRPISPVQSSRHGRTTGLSAFREARPPLSARRWAVTICSDA